MTSPPSGVTDQITEPESVLLLAPSEVSADQRACTDLLTRTPPERANVLSVTVGMTPDDRLAIWEQNVGETIPEQATIIDARPGTDGSDGGETVASEPDIELDVLPPSAGLTDIGLVIARLLGKWSETDRTTQICLHSLTELLQRFEEHDVVELLAGLQDLRSEMDVCTHHHLDPASCADSTLATLRPLYDAVLEHDGDGWMISEATDDEVMASFRWTTPPSGGSSPLAADRPETVPIPYSFDTVIDLLSAPLRRTILYYLKDRQGGEYSIESVIDDVYDRAVAVPIRDPQPREELVTVCHHNHLPHLAEAGVIELNREDRTLRYDPNPALESCLRYVETLELG